MPAGAASHELRALACLSRISTSGDRTEDARDTARLFTLGIRAQSRAVPSSAGRACGQIRERAGGASWAPVRPSLKGAGKELVGPFELPHTTLGSSFAQYSGVRGSG